MFLLPFQASRQPGGFHLPTTVLSPGSELLLHFPPSLSNQLNCFSSPWGSMLRSTFHPCPFLIPQDTESWDFHPSSSLSQVEVAVLQEITGIHLFPPKQTAHSLSSSYGRRMALCDNLHSLDLSTYSRARDGQASTEWA